MLLVRDDVKRDIKLTDKQSADLDALREDMQEKMRDLFQSQMGSGGGRPDFEKMRTLMDPIMKEVKEKTEKILEPAQQTRLKQIWIQLSGSQVITNEEMQKELKMEAPQVEKVKELQKKQGAAMAELRQKVQAGELQREEMRDLMKKNGDIMKTELGKVLTDKQREQLKGMEGPKFTPDPEDGN